MIIAALFVGACSGAAHESKHYTVNGSEAVDLIGGVSVACDRGDALVSVSCSCEDGCAVEFSIPDGANGWTCSGQGEKGTAVLAVECDRP